MSEDRNQETQDSPWGLSPILIVTSKPNESHRRASERIKAQRQRHVEQVIRVWRRHRLHQDR